MYATHTFTQIIEDLLFNFIYIKHQYSYNVILYLNSKSHNYVNLL